MKRPEIHCMKCGVKWCAWFQTDPHNKFVARSAYEAVGKLLWDFLHPGTWVIHVLSDGAKRIFPKPWSQTDKANELGALELREYVRKEESRG